MPSAPRKRRTHKIKASGKCTIDVPTTAELDELKKATMPVHHEMNARLGRENISVFYAAAGFAIPQRHG